MGASINPRSSTFPSKTELSETVLGRSKEKLAAAEDSLVDVVRSCIILLIVDDGIIPVARSD